MTNPVFAVVGPKYVAELGAGVNEEVRVEGKVESVEGKTPEVKDEAGIAVDNVDAPGAEFRVEPTKEVDGYWFNVKPVGKAESVDVAPGGGIIPCLD